MPRRRSSRSPSSPAPRRRLLRALGACAALALAASPAARAGEMVAVVNPSNAVANLSVSGLRLIYGGYKKSWPNGDPITLLLPSAGSPAMETVVKKIFRKASESEVSQYYVALVFQQKLAHEPPRLSASQSAAIVRGDATAIAIVDRDELRDAAGLRVVPIEEP